jgi:hypothetical protein
MIDKMLVSVVASGLMVIVFMQMVLLGLPLFQKMEFDAICHKYVLLMDRAGGMDALLAGMLQQELTERGFAVTRVDGSETAGYGEELDLSVSARFSTCSIRRDLLLEEVSLSVSYQSSTVCRVLKSYTEDP